MVNDSRNLEQLRRVYFVGYAKLASSMTVGVFNGTFSLALLVDILSGDILECSSAFVSEISRNQVSGYFKGYNLILDYETICENVLFCHQGNLQKPLLKSFNEIRRKYILLHRQQAPLIRRMCKYYQINYDKIPIDNG